MFKVSDEEPASVPVDYWLLITNPAIQPASDVYLLNERLCYAHSENINKGSRIDKQLRSLDHICPTSNICVRLFSRTGLITYNDPESKTYESELFGGIS